MRKLEIYIHIPFCVRKCAYCDFLSVAAGREQRDRYVKTLLEEIRSGIPVNAPYAEDGDYIVTSVFFGGGTPSVLPADQIAEIMGALRSQFRFSEDAEISLECNPGTFGELLPDDSGFPACELGGTSAAGTKPEEWFGCGINRLSIGLQSADNAELAQLGRIHTWEIFLESYEKARQAGFRNINIDLMSALPGQTAASWEKTLRQVLQLAPEHISAYSLIIEEGTPFYQKYHEDDLRRMNGAQPLYLSSEEEERKMYVLTGALLDEAGFQHYEISNYARPGLECRHNIGYWQGTEYMGFGLGASSFLKYSGNCIQSEPQSESEARVLPERPVSVRFKNPADFSDYEQAVRLQKAGEKRSGAEASIEILTSENEMEEFMFLGLRMLCGVSEQEFSGRFGRPIDEVYGATIEHFLSMGLLMREEGRIFLSPRGIDLSNSVMAEFLLS